MKYELDVFEASHWEDAKQRMAERSADGWDLVHAFPTFWQGRIWFVWAKET